MRSRAAWLLAVGATTLGLAAGVAFATIPDESSVIHGCRQDDSGKLRVIDSATSSCNPSETRSAGCSRGRTKVFHVDPVEITGTSRATGNLIMTLHLHARRLRGDDRGRGRWNR